MERLFGWDTDPEKQAEPSSGGGYISGLAEAARDISEASRERFRVQGDPIEVKTPEAIDLRVHVGGRFAAIVGNGTPRDIDGNPAGAARPEVSRDTKDAGRGDHGRRKKRECVVRHPADGPRNCAHFPSR